MKAIKMKNSTFSIKPLNVLILIAIISSLIFLSSCTSKRTENKVLFPFYVADSENFNIFQYKLGYMDKDGNVIIKPQFEPESDYENGEFTTAVFHENRAAVQIGQLYGYIDNTGKVVIQPQYERTFSFSDGLAPVITVNKTADGMTYYMRGYIDINGNMIIKPNKSFVPNPFSEGLCFNVLEETSSLFPLNQVYGLINKEGKLLVPPKFYAALPFNENRAAVVTKGENGTVGWGFIDPQGNTIIPPKYDEVQSFSEGLAAVLTITPLNFSNISSNLDDYFRRQQWQYLDKNGKVVIQPKIDLDIYNISCPIRCPSVISFGSFHDERAKFTIVYTDETYRETCMNKNNDYKLKYPFEDFYSECEKDNYSPYFTRIGYIDKTGKVVIPPNFSDAGDFSEGLAYVRETYPGTYKHFSAYGFINSDGKQVIDYRLRMPADFHNGLAIFEKIDYGRHMTLYINKSGTVILPKYTINLSI